MAADPTRTAPSGLKRGATLDEVKRAYRRLAKINHPDAAGEAALPRFLAIQAAYEQLAGPGTPGHGTTAARPATAVGSPTPTRRAGRTGVGRGTRRRPARAPGALGDDRQGRGGRHGRRTADRPRRASGAAAGRVERDRPGEPAAPPARPGRRRTYEPRPDSGTPGTPPPGGKPRAPNKATLGRPPTTGRMPNRSSPTGAAPTGTARPAARTGRSTRRNTPIRASTGRSTRHAPGVRPERAAATRLRPAAAPDAEASPETAGEPEEPADPATAGRPAGPTHTTSSWWDSTAGATGEPDAPEDGGPATGPVPRRAAARRLRPDAGGRRATRHGPTTAAARPRARRGRHHARPDRRALRWHRAAASRGRSSAGCRSRSGSAGWSAR